MKTFATGLLIAATEAVNLQGAYEHDHYNHVPYTVARHESYIGTHLEPRVDYITQEVRGEQVFFHEHTDESGFGDHESDSTVRTIVSFGSVGTHDHSDEYSESGYGLNNSDYYSSQSGEAGGFFRDHNGNLGIYVDYSDDDKIGFTRGPDGYIGVYTESDDPFETDDGYYDNYGYGNLGPGGYGGYYGRGVHGPYGGLGPFDGTKHNRALDGKVSGLGNGGYPNGLNDLGYGGYLGGLTGRGYGYGAFNDHSYREHGYGDHGHETSDESFDSDGSSYSHSHSSYSIHTFDSSHDTHFHIEEYVTEITKPILGFDVVEHETIVPLVRPAFYEDVYTHPDHNDYRYDFGNQEAYGYEYETHGGHHDALDGYPRRVPISHGLNVPAYDIHGNPQLFAIDY